jgi:hypothetical protein
MAEHKKRFRTGLVVLVAISLFVCPLAAGGFGIGGANAQLPFTPSIAPLEITRTVVAPDLNLLATIAPPFGPGMPRSSREAIDLCLHEFTWGDADMGYCRTAQEGTYYVWTDPDHVLVVPEGAPFMDEFQDAVVARAAELQSTQRLMDDLGLEIVGLPASVILIGVGCTAGGPVGWIVCAVAFAAGVWDGVAMTHTAENSATDVIAFFQESRRAVYYLCRMQGGPAPVCLEAAGITAEELAPPQEDSSDEGSTP